MSTWTFKQQLRDSGATTYTLLDAVSDHGTTIALFFEFNTFNFDQIWRSTDGGNSWTLITSSIGTGGGMGKLLYAGIIGGNKTWYALGTVAGASYKSTDDGLTWNSVTDALPGGGVNGGAYDGNATIVGVQNNNSNIECSVNGSALTIHATPADWARPGPNTGGMIWDGSQFVSLGQHGSGTIIYTAFTAPSGFTAAAGPTWTEVISNSSNPWTNGGNSSSSGLFYIPSLGYAAEVNSNHIVISSTVAGLSTATNLNPPLDGTSLRGLYAVGGMLIIGNNFPNVYRSPDGSTWTVDTFSQAFLSGEHLGAAVYDAVNSSAILIGSQGSAYVGLPPISISPLSVTVNSGTNQQFTAITSPNGTAVTWSCLHGTITSNGLYTAPATGFTSDVVTVAWTSNANVQATAAVTIVPNTIAISPTSVSVPFGSSTLFSITTQPAGLAAKWSVNGIVGGDSVHGTVMDGYYIAPAVPNGVASVTVTATRQDMPSLSASATVTLTIPTIGGGGPGSTNNLTGKFRAPKVFKPVVLAKAATIPLRIYEPEENKTVKG